MNKYIWITWEKQRRNQELSRALGFDLFELSEIDSIKNYLRKYIIGVSKTILILYKEMPVVVCCQNPSLILAFSLVLFKRIFKYSLCVDAHNAGLFPLEGHSIILSFVARFVQKNADLTIVTNDNLKKIVEKNYGNGFVLQDKIPSIDKIRGKKLKGKFNLLFICTYAKDEPYESVFAAAKELDENIVIYVTGDFNKAAIEIKNIPDNLILMGYINEQKYVEMLNSVDAIIDLTTREDCLVCGAYEGVAVEKPLILSDTVALKKYFTGGAIFTDNSTASIVNAVNKVINIKDQLVRDVVAFGIQCSVHWNNKKNILEKKIDSLTSRRRG